MKLISYNVNGIRSAMSKDLVGWIGTTDADVICLQEIKATEDQIDVEAFRQLGYEHCYWYSAQKKGYSGTAVLSKTKPARITFGMGIPDYDREGRLILAEFDDFSLICSYFPSGTTGEERQAFKMKYLHDFLQYLQTPPLQQKKLLITGDFNICHKPIDINQPKRHETTSGFLPEERAWMDSFEALGFVDTLRIFNSQPEQYSWWSYRFGARARNLGWRIDYFWCSANLRSQITAAEIHPTAVHSDHCPISVQLSIKS